MRENMASGGIGAPLSGAQVGAILFAGVAGILFAGVGPYLLGGLEAAGRISPGQLGQAGTAELLTMGIAAGLTGPIWGLHRLRLLTLICGLSMATLNIASIWTDGWTIILVRGANGIPSGALIWLMTAMIVRSARPERWAAIYLTAQGLAQGLIVVALGALGDGPTGLAIGFGSLGAIGIATCAAAVLMPMALAPLPVDPDQPIGRPSVRGLVALAAGFAFNAGILAVWIYVDPLSRQAGHPIGTASLAFSFSLFAQVAGGTVATFTAERLSTTLALIVSLLGLAAAMAAMGTLPSATLFLIIATVFGFIWMFSSPFYTPLVIAADPTRRSAAYGSGVAILGCSAGPFLASLVVSDSDVRSSISLGLALLAVSLAIVVGLALKKANKLVTDA